MFSSSCAFLALFAASVLGTPALLHTVETFRGETTGRFLVTLKSGISKPGLINQIKKNATITHDWDIINGFAARLDDDTLNALRAHPDVESIAEDGIMYAAVTQTNAPWGLSRLSSTTRLTNQNVNALTFNYTFDPSAGVGVDIYVVDTVAIRRARGMGGTFGPYPDVDDNGHGTYCAAVAAGCQFGVAKAATIYGVKCLSAAGSGSVSDIVSGLNFVLVNSRSTGRPSVVTMSLSGGATTTLDNAIASLTNGGVHVAVPAGNDGADAINTSPARAPSANTVGATTIADTRATFSNFGSVVDIFAPGQNIISAWIGSTTATMSLSGTSSATPQIAGLIAYLVGVRGNMSPAGMTTLLKTLSVKGALSGVPSGTLNDLAHNDASPALARDVNVLPCV